MARRGRESGEEHVTFWHAAWVLGALKHPTSKREVSQCFLFGINGRGYVALKLIKKCVRNQ